MSTTWHFETQQIHAGWDKDAATGATSLPIHQTTSGASTTAEQAAWVHTQIGTIELDPQWHGGDHHRLGAFPAAAATLPLTLARRIAHTTYRSPRELEERFATRTQDGVAAHEGGRLTVQSYLDHHGDKLVRRFDAGSYVTLCRTMLSHDVGRGRGGVAEALARVRARTLAVAVDSDRLFLPDQVWRIAEHVPGALYREIHSLHGHDGFLIEEEQVSTILCDFLTHTAPGRGERRTTRLAACSV